MISQTFQILIIQMIVGTILLILACAPGFYIIFDYTHAKSWWFLLGFGMCLVVQMTLLFFFCLFKLQKAYRDSGSLKVSSNTSLDPQNQYPFIEHEGVDQLYYNKYTDQARVFQKKNTLRVANLQDYFFEENQINQQPRAQTMKFLREVKGYYNTLNKFNNALVNFGKNLFNIEEDGIFTKRKYYFSQFQKSHASQMGLHQLVDEERQILHNAQVKLKMKKDSESLILPNWSIVLKCIQYVGTQFSKIEDMRLSNSEMLEMISKKVLDDYEFIQNEIKNSRRSLQEARNNLQKLTSEHEKYQAEEINLNVTNQPQMDMMLWLRRQMYEFKDLERRIRQNQIQLKEQSQKLKYYKEKLGSFTQQNKKKYLKIVKTRFIAFLDSYFITIDESINKVKTMFNFPHNYKEKRPPKVNKLKLSKNMNESLQAEKLYQKQYFARVNFYEQKLDGLIQSMSSTSQFLGSMKKILSIIIENLKDCQKNQQKSMKYFTKFFHHLKAKSEEIYNEISKLTEANDKMRSWNEPKLTNMKSKIAKYVQSSQKILLTVNINEGPILHKYKLIKSQIQTNYKLLQEQIARIHEFQAMYITHTNRIKKIFIISLLNFLNFQKKFVNFGQINEKNLSDGEYDMTEEDFMLENSTKNYIEKDITNEFDIDKVDGLQTGYQFSPTYLALLNRFLFVAYTQWKQSQFFKKTLTQQLFIAFNSEPNDSFTRIDVKDMEFSGDPPQVVWLKQLKSEQNQSLFDIHITFKGKWSFKIKTSYKLFRMNVPLQLTIQVQELYCVIRLCFVPSKIGNGWFSFIGEPIPKFKIMPSIGSYTIDLQTSKNMFHNFLLKNMKKNTYPVRQKLPIPMSKENQDLLLIEKRFKALALDREM